MINLTQTHLLSVSTVWRMLWMSMPAVLVAVGPRMTLRGMAHVLCVLRIFTFLALIGGSEGGEFRVRGGGSEGGEFRVRGAILPRVTTVVVLRAAKTKTGPPLV